MTIFGATAQKCCAVFLSFGKHYISPRAFLALENARQTVQAKMGDKARMRRADRKKSTRQRRRGRQSPLQDYRCEDCGTECREPIYVRLHFTRNGWSRATGQKR